MKKILSQSTLVLSLLCVVTACDKEAPQQTISEAKDQADNAAKTDKGATDKLAPAQQVPPAKPVGKMTAKPVEVRLITTGKAPKSELRYAFKVGRTHRMQMDMKMSMKMSMGPNSNPEVSMPTIRTVVKLEEKEILANGNIKTDATIEEMSVLDEEDADPGILNALKPELAGVKNLKGWSEMTARGFIIGGKYTMPENATPQVRTMVDQLEGNMKQLSFPLPEEAVGVGANWKVIQQVSNGGMNIDQVSDCKLKELMGQTLKLACKLTQSAKPQTISEGMPGGAVGKLISHDATGDVKLDLDLSQLIPKSVGAITAKTKMDVEAAGQKMSMGTEMAMTMTVTRLK